MQIKKHEIPEGWSLESADFFNKCLLRKKESRLGLNGANELKQHVWLRDYDFTGLEEKKLPAPFIPKVNLLWAPVWGVDMTKIRKARELKTIQKDKHFKHLQRVVEVDKNGASLYRYDINKKENRIYNDRWDPVWN